MKPPHALLLTALLLPVAIAFASTPAQRASADIAAVATAPLSVVEKTQRGAQLTFADIQDLARHGVPDDVTLAYLRSTGMGYHLTTDDFDRLRTAGVSDRVLNYLLLASPLEIARVARVYRPAPVYGYRP